MTIEKDYFFARKFEPVVSNSIINIIESWLKEIPNQDNPSINKYWQNDVHHLDTVLSSNDGKNTIYSALARVALRRIGYMCDSHKIETNQTLIHLKEGNLYFDNDIYKGNLITFEVSFSSLGNNSIFELFSRPVNHFLIHKYDGIMERLISLHVCRVLLCLCKLMFNSFTGLQ